MDTCNTCAIISTLAWLARGFNPHSHRRFFTLVFIHDFCNLDRMLLGAGITSLLHYRNFKIRSRSQSCRDNEMIILCYSCVTRSITWRASDHSGRIYCRAVLKADTILAVLLLLRLVVFILSHFCVLSKIKAKLNCNAVESSCSWRFFRQQSFIIGS